MAVVVGQWEDSEASPVTATGMSIGEAYDTNMMSGREPTMLLIHFIRRPQTF